MGKRGKKKLKDSTNPRHRIIEKGIGKRNGKEKKLESVEVKALSSVAASASDDEFAGYIFLCSGRTKPECFSYRVFGLPSMRIDIVTKIKPGSKLFLFDFDVKLLYGVYSATSTGTMNLEPLAFGGRFPAQVKFEIFKECMPMPESTLKHVIKDNYQGGSKFRQNLSADQVDKLISLFRPLPPPASESPTSLLSKETLSRRILQQEIEKQNRSLDIYTMSQHTPGSQYIASRFDHVSYKAQSLSLPLHDSARPLLSTDWAHERLSFPSQSYSLNKLVPYDNLYQPKLPRHSYLSEYSVSNPSLHGLSCGYMNGTLLSRTDVNHRMGLSNDYHIYQNQNIGQGYIPQQIPQQILAPPPESDRAPSSVLAAAYWAAVANEIPQPSVGQVSDSGHNKTEQDSGTSVQNKPPNLTSQSILDAYWEAKNLEDSRQAHPGTSHMLPHPSQQPISTSQGSTFIASHAYYGDQSHLQHPNQLPIPISSQGGTVGVFPTSHTEIENRNGNQVATFTSELQHQVVYDPSGIQMQHGLQQQVVYDPSGIQMQYGLQQQVVYDPSGIHMQHGLQHQVVYDPSGIQMQHGLQQQVVYDPSGIQMQHGLQQQVMYDPAGTQIQQGVIPQYYPT